jgi:signal transduction histidine kinase
MLSIPGLRDLIKTRDSKREAGPVKPEFFRAAGQTSGLDLKAYLKHLAAGLGIELLALVEVSPRTRGATITVAGSQGIACDLALPDLENGGVLSALIRQAKSWSGTGRIFTKGEVFPNEGAWCDVVPLDSKVTYFFLPLEGLPLMSGCGQSGAQPTVERFVLTTSDAKPEEAPELGLKAAAAASLISLSLSRAQQTSTTETLTSLKHLLDREGYGCCTVDDSGSVITRSGTLLAEIDSRILTQIAQKASSLQAPASVAGHEPQNVTPDSIKEVTALAYPVSGAGGPARWLVAIKRGRDAVAAGRRDDRLGLLSRFMSSIAHEIKNPLTGIAAGVQYLSRKLQTGATEDDTIKFVLAEINRLNRIVDDLYKIAKPPELVVGTTSISDVVGRSLLCLSEEILKKRLHVEQNLQEGIPEFKADGDRLQQILINIIKNAVEVSTEKARIQIDTVQDDEKVIVRVTDCGPGIAEEDRDRIFEPFYSTKAAGTGLGLCISQRIIDQHGGRIYIETPDEGGTTFVVELPLGS